MENKLASERFSEALVIAGFDPCGGAGILADVRVMQANEVRAQAVNTANTFQNEKEFKSVEYISLKMILEQIDLLFSQKDFDVVKIGLVENLDVLEEIIKRLKLHNSKIIIVWDPILKSSTGFDFHNNLASEQLITILGQCYLVTPNKNELDIIIKVLFGDDVAIDFNDSIKKLMAYTSIYLKGGHADGENCTDFLYRKNKSLDQRIAYSDVRIPGAEKHGSGCVLSSAIASRLAWSDSLEKSCESARKYMQKYMMSSDNLLGWYKF